MDVGNRDALTPTDRPFALLVVGDDDRSSADALKTMLRRMGLQPEVVAGGGIDAPRFRLHLGAQHILVGSAGAPRLDFADPDDGATSLLGTALPGDWQRDCWFFLPEADDGASAILSSGQLFDFFRMMVLLIDLFAADHFFWSPARLWSDAPQFRGAIAEMQASGMPPVLHLVAFRRRDGAGRATIATRGLAAFAGQELEAPIPAGWDMAAMVRRLARLSLDIMLNGPIGQAQQAPGLESGEWVAMTPRPGRGGRPGAVLVEFSRDR